MGVGEIRWFLPLDKKLAESGYGGKSPTSRKRRKKWGTLEAYLMVKVKAEDLPPPGVGLETTIWAVPAEAMSV
jgi:hypothetical protein